MAVYSVSQIGPGRAVDVDDEYNSEWKVFHQVLVDSAYDGEGTVLSAVGLPQLWSNYVGYEDAFFSETGIVDGGGFYNVAALCTHRSAKQDGQEWMKWIVESTFTTNWQEIKQLDPTDDPIIAWTEMEFERRKVVIDAVTGQPVVNSVGELLDGRERDFGMPVYCYESKEEEITELIDFGYCPCVNEDTFNDKAPGTLLLTINVGKPKRRNGILYYPHGYRMKFKDDFWWNDPLDRGTKVKGLNGTLTNALDDTNQPVDAPFFLDGKGNLLPSGSPPVTLSKFNGTGYTNDYPLKPFRPLQFLLDNPNE